MARRHKHEEHVNHERWVISFADMMTLLFALFVVLYAMGVQDLEKLKELKKSIRWAFNIAGEGKTQDVGIFEKQSGGGEVAVPAPLVTAQDGAMREFLSEVLQDYQEVAGRSLEIVQTDDTLSLSAPLSDFFAAAQPFPIRREVQGWLDKTVDASLTFASDVRLIIEVPDVPLGRDARGRALTSVDLAIERLKSIGLVVAKNPQIRPGMLSHEWRRMTPRPGQIGGWEDQARVTIAFSNGRPGSR